MNIDLGLIRRAMDFYGCLEMKVPYLVDPDIMDFTCPPGVVDERLTHINGKQYVASAEQSFLQLEKEGKLTPELKWMIALTPCYRDEYILDETHYNIFLKLEIFDYNPKGSVDYSRFWAIKMQQFFAEEGLNTNLVETAIGYDVCTKCGLELGSFGYRVSPKGVKYVYGTGLAEPRASMAIEKYTKPRVFGNHIVLG